MPAQYVKAYIKRNKHDAADAEAICETPSAATALVVAVALANKTARIAWAVAPKRIPAQGCGGLVPPRPALELARE
jgi:hypothetical protein